MANTKSAKKAARQSVRRTVINKSRRTRLRSATRKVEEAIAAEDRRWRAYAEENHRKVNEAPKFKRGSSRGHSVISHRYVYSEGFVSQAIHIRQMVRILREKNPD